MEIINLIKYVSELKEDIAKQAATGKPNEKIINTMRKKIDSLTTKAKERKAQTIVNHLKSISKDIDCLERNDIEGINCKIDNRFQGENFTFYGQRI